MYRWRKLTRSRLDSLVIVFILGGLFVYLVAQWTASLSWRMVHDTPLLTYMAFLIDRYGAVPYRDIYTTDYPGALLFHLAIGKWVGYGDSAFRLVDVVWLTALLVVTWGIMRRFGRTVAAGSVMLFALSYFEHGPSMSLQRDYVAILPIAVAVWWAMAAPNRHMWLQAYGIGVLFGLAATIKPPLAIGLPLAWGMLIMTKEASSWKQRLREGLGLGIIMLAGLALPLLAAGWWIYHIGAWPSFLDMTLRYIGAWPAFLDMTLRYMPLHLGMTGDHKVIRGITRDLYLWRSYGQLGGLGIWLAPAAVGLYIALFGQYSNSVKRRQLWLLAALTLAYSIEPVFSGQFWPYHWLPFQYFVVVLAGLSLQRLPAATTSLRQRLFPLFLVALVALMALAPRDEFYRQMTGQAPDPPKYGRVDTIAAFLKENMVAGDRVQPLDWTGGAVHAMLIAQARLATPYIYDYYFYHHISDPTIQHLRADFIADLSAQPPRFIIDVQKSPRPHGRDTSTEFPELRAFIANHYTAVQNGDGYIIYELQG